MAFALFCGSFSLFLFLREEAPLLISLSACVYLFYSGWRDLAANTVSMAKERILSVDRSMSRFSHLRAYTFFFTIFSCLFPAKSILFFLLSPRQHVTTYCAPSSWHEKILIVDQDMFLGLLFKFSFFFWFEKFRLPPTTHSTYFSISMSPSLRPSRLFIFWSRAVDSSSTDRESTFWLKPPLIARQWRGTQIARTHRSLSYS